MQRAAVTGGKIICFRCRRDAEVGRCRCPAAVRNGALAEPARPPTVERVHPAVLGMWLAGAALAGSLVGAALTLLHG